MRDIATILSRIEIFRIGNDEIMGKISKKAEEIISDMKIDMGILLKKERVIG